MALLYLILIIIPLIFLIIKYISKRYTYWTQTNVPFIKPQFPYGNIKGANKKIHLGFLTKKFYLELKGKGPFGGVYFFHNPVALALDPEFIKTILIKDFSHFHDRGVYHNEKGDPLTGHLFAIGGQKWRNLRSKLTPTFTSGKMKFMFPTIVNVAENFEKCLSKIIANDDVVEIKEILARFTTDVIGTCAFGIECNSLNDPNATFRQMGKKVFENPKINPVQFLLIVQFQSIARFFNIKVIHNDVSSFFINAVKETVEYREQNKIKRNDFMDLLIELKNSESGELGSLSIYEIAAQAFVFFLAGFETSSTLMTFCLYELAINKNIQKKLRDEIQEILKKHQNKLTYEAMLDMPYLEQVINETLRKYPPVVNLIRTVTKDYHVPEVKHTLKKDTQVMIPIYGIHHDPEIYPNPDKFDPDRFLPERAKQRNQFSFLPFGDGPRNCIGLRFGLMQARIGLITILNKFELSASPQLKTPLELSNTTPVLSTKDSMYLKIRKF